MTAARRPVLAHRFFFALKPDEVTANRTHAFAEREFGDRGLLAPERHHVTLAITDDYDQPYEGLIDALLRAGHRVAAAPFELVLDRLSGSARSVALRPEHVVPPLRDLQQAIAEAMAEEGLTARDGWRFSPHQTLGYRAGSPFSRRVEGFHWQVGGFVLVHSFVGLTHHETLHGWTLKAPENPQLSLL
jgi:2'-5' RNA ligase